MEKIDFIHQGRRMHLTRREVIDAMRHQVPEPIREWAVEVEGVCFPVKQVRAQATGEARGDFTSHQAADVLRRLGFQIRAGADVPPPYVPSLATSGAGEFPALDERSHLREVALTAAVALAQPQELKDTEAVLDLAATFEAWLTRP